MLIGFAFGFVLFVVNFSKSSNESSTLMTGKEIVVMILSNSNNVAYVNSSELSSTGIVPLPVVSLPSLGIIKDGCDVSSGILYAAAVILLLLLLNIDSTIHACNTHEHAV